MAVGNRKQAKIYKAYSVRLEEISPEGNKSEGSGILVWHGNRLYLLTAGHCYPTGDINNLKVESWDGEKFFQIRLKEQIAFSYKNSKDRDGLDFSIIEVDPGSVNLPAEKVTLGSLSDESDYNEVFFSFGYPAANRSGVSLMFYADEEDYTWKIHDYVVNKNGNIIKDIAGFSGSGIIDITPDSLKCVGTLRGFEDEFARLLCVRSTPSSTYLQHLPDPIPENRSMMTAPEGYFQRYCWKFGSMEINHVLWDIPRLTLLDFLDGNDEAFSYRNIVLSGAAQTGKSYEFKKLASDLSLRGENVALEELKNDIDLDGQLQKFPSGGYLLLDGLDEVKQKDLPDFAEKIRAIAANNPTMRLVVSCRENFVNYIADENFGVLVLENFSRDDVRDYLRHIGHDSDDIFEQLMQQNIQDLCSNPYNVKCIVEMGIKPDGSFELPESLVDVYERYIGSLFNKDEGKTAAERKNTREQSLRVLRKVAYTMVARDVQALSAEEICRIPGVPSGRDTVDLLLYNSVIRGHGNEYSFTSNGIKDFLAASHLLEYSPEEVMRKVSIPETDVIRPKLYNTVRWWLNHLSTMNGISTETIRWICKDDNDPSLLLSCSPSSIPEEERFEIAKKILGKCKEQDCLYASYYSGLFKVLLRFAYSPLFINYLNEELKNTAEPGAHLYNLLSLATYIPWNEIDGEKSKALKETLLSLIARFPDWESGYSLFYWVIENDQLYNDWELVDELVDRTKDSKNPEVLSALCAIIYRGGLADKYLDYLIDAEPLIVDQGTLMVSRDVLYSALGSLKEKENIKKILYMISDGSISKRDYHGIEGYCRMIKALLLSLLESESGEEEYRNLFERNFSQIHYCPHDKIDLLKAFDEVNREKEISDDAILQKTHSLLNPFERTPEEIEANRIKRQEELNNMMDHEEFRKSVLRAVDEYESLAAGSVSVFDIGLKYGMYVNEFLISFAGWKNPDLDGLRNAIEDKETYELFKFEELTKEITNRNLDLNIPERELSAVKRKGEEIVGRVALYKEKIDYSFFKAALKLLVRGDIYVSNEVLKALIPYSFETFSVSSGDDRSVADVIEDCVSEDELVDIYKKAIISGDFDRSPNLKRFLTFLFQKGANDTRNWLYDQMVTEPESVVAFFLLDLFLENPDYKGRIISDFNKFSPGDQLRIFEGVGNAVLPSMEQNLLDNPENMRGAVIQKLLAKGSMVALEYFYEHFKELSTSLYWWSFSYDSAESLPLLFKLLEEFHEYEEDYLGSVRSLETCIGNVASRSDELCDTVVSEIENRFKDDSGYQSRFIEYCRRRRLLVKADDSDV